MSGETNIKYQSYIGLVIPFCLLVPNYALSRVTLVGIYKSKILLVYYLKFYDVLIIHQRKKHKLCFYVNILFVQICVVISILMYIMDPLPCVINY